MSEFPENIDKIKKKIKKYLIGGLIFATIVACLEGCISPSLKMKRAEKLLNEKYQEEFQVVSCRSTFPPNDYFMVIAYATNYPNLLFQASVSNDYKWIMDSYVTKRLCNRISDKISQNLETLEANYYVFTNVLLGDTTFNDPEISLEKYLAEMPGTYFKIYVCMDTEESSVENITSSLSGMLTDIPEINGAIELYLTDSELLTEIKEYKSTNEGINSEFDEMTEKAHIGTINFESSKFAITEQIIKEMIDARENIKL